MTAHDPDLMRRIALERDDAVRQAFEEAANALEIRQGAEQYMRAWRIAADFLRLFKPTLLTKS
jgi:hypothetical protein